MIQFALDTYGLSAYGLWTMFKMNLNTNMNSDLTQIIWSKMSVYIRSLKFLQQLKTTLFGSAEGVVGRGRRWTASTHFFVRKYPFCTFYVHFWPCKRLAPTHFLFRPPTSFSGLHPCIRRMINIVHIIMYDEGK